MTELKSYFVKGFNDTSIYVVSKGEATKIAVVFIHGTTHAYCVWKKQFASDLLSDYRLVAYDLRGHGRSDRPNADYEKSESWAADLRAVIDSTGAEKVVLVGWSFGGMVISDYLRHYGEDKLAGIVFANASTRIGVPGRENDIGERYKALGPSLCSQNMEIGTQALIDFVNLCVYTKHNPEDFYLFLGMVANTSPAARAGILLRHVNNDDVLKKISVPMLMIHGEDDEIVLKCVTERHMTLIPSASVKFYPKTGHCSFWERSDEFNSDVKAFLSQLTKI